jgi:glycosyltransferase involved in cell wall biosynthesis
MTLLRTSRASFDVIMLTTVHQATDPRIFHREAMTLVESGLTVSIIGKHPHSERLEGVWIEALPEPANRLRRLMLAFTLLKHAYRLHGRVYIFHDLELLVAGLALRLIGRKVIYDCHENTPETMLQKTWIPPLLRLPVAFMVAVTESLGSRLLTGVVVVNEELHRRFPRKRTIVVRNLPPATVIDHLGQGPPLSSRAKAVIYAGGLSRIRGIGELVQAFRGINSGAELWLVGEFSDPLFREQTLSSLPPNVKWFGQKDYAEVLELYHHAKVGAVLIHPTSNHRNAMPIKIFEYLAAGLPVIASDMPQFTPLLQGCGVLVNPEDVAQIRTAVEALLCDEARLAEMSRIGRERIATSFRWEDDARRLVEFCNEVTTPLRPSVAHS